jgi:hypothetical protein
VTGHPSAAGWQMVSDCEYYTLRHLLSRHHAGIGTFNHCIYGEGHWSGEDGRGYVALYDYLSDGILRAYEEVLGVQGDDYQKVKIGMGGVMLSWGLEPMIRIMAAHALPAPLDKVFPETAPARRFAGDLPSQSVGSNPLYYFTPEERRQFVDYRWQYNACFLNSDGKPLVGLSDWDMQGKLTTQAVSRLAPGWRHSRWLLEKTRYGKGSPFRQVSVEGYGHAAEQLANCILFEKEFLSKLDQNLRQASPDPYVQNYVQGTDTATKQLALFDWGATGSIPVGRPFQGTGYWPAYFADLMRRILGETARQPRGIYDHGTFTFDSYIAPDARNIGINSDTLVFTPETGAVIQTVDINGTKVQTVPEKPGWADVGKGKRIPVVENQVALDKDIRHLIRFVGMMTHRLAALPEQEINGHVISGVMSKYCDRPGSVYETGNGSGDEHRFWVLLYDHNPPDLESQDCAVIPVALQIRGLPAGVASARVTVHRVDRDHGSVFTVTEQHPPNHGPVYSPQEIEMLKQKAALAKDEDFPRNGERLGIAGGTANLDLTLGANRVLLVEIDWGS